MYTKVDKLNILVFLKYICQNW